MLNFAIGDRITHQLDGDGTILRVKVGSKQNLLDVLFDEGSGTGKFIEEKSKFIEAVNGQLVNKRLAKWRPTNYVAASNRDFSEQQFNFIKNHVTRITYRPHPFNFEKFVRDYESVSGTKCPLAETNRHESAYADCAEIYFKSYPPPGLFEFKLKQCGICGSQRTWDLLGYYSKQVSQ